MRQSRPSHPHQRSQRRSAVLPLAFVLAGALGMVGVGSGHLADGTPTDEQAALGLSSGATRGAAEVTDRPAPVDFLAPGPRQRASGVAVGDQTDQRLAGLAARGRRVVAVGDDTSYNATRPLFVVSDDGGRSWLRGYLDTEAIAATLGDERATSVAAGRSGFVATGQGADGGPALWTSADGTSWSRTETDPAVFPASDRVDRAVEARGRYFLLGSSGEATGRATGRIIVWTSRDLVTWQRWDLSLRGLDDVRGLPYAADLALHGRDIVIAGGVEDSTDTEQPNRMMVWRSGDGGRSFVADPTPVDLGGSYRAFARDLSVSDGTLRLAASGDGTSADGPSPSWDGVVLEAEGTTWTTTASAAFGTPADEHPRALVRAGAGWVLAGYSEGDAADAVVATGTDLSALSAVDDPSLDAAGTQAVTGGVAVGDAAVLTGWSSESGSVEPRIWRVTDGVLDPVTLPAEASSGRPSTEVERVVASPGGFTAYGASGASPVVWTSSDFSTWAARGLAGRSADVTGATLADGEVLRDGTSIAVGTLARGLGQDAAVWLRDGRSWRQAESPAFRSRDDAGYGGLSPTAVAVGRDAVVVTAMATVNGQREAHPLVGSTDGTTWSAGHGADPITPTASDEYFARTPYADFRAPVNGSIDMSAVTPTSSGFVIGGSRARAGAGEQAVVWTSDHAGLTWRRATNLPRVPGTEATGVTRLVSSGATVVASGYARRAGEAATTWVSWTSRDGGATWRPAVVSALAQAVVNDVVVVPGGFLALGSQGPLTDRDAAAWSSSDGRTWQAVTLDLPRADGPGRQFLAGGVVGNGVVHVVAGDVLPGGGGYYTTDLPIPVPDGGA